MKIFYLHLTLLLSLFSLRCFCQYDSIQPQGIYSSNFIIDEKPRNITYYMPLRYGKEESYPLLIVLHDEKSSAKNMIKKWSELIHAKADSANCIVMYPDALGGHWNTNVKDSVNDVGFISIMLEFFVRQFSCDVNHVYLLGFGNGGDLCYLIHCEGVYKPAAIATMNATADETDFSNCNHPKSISAINIKEAAIEKPGINKALLFLFARHKTE